MTVRAEIVTVRCKRLPQSTQCVTSGRYVRLIVCWYSFFFLMTFPCSLALFATLLSILSPHVGREYCPHGVKSQKRAKQEANSRQRLGIEDAHLLGDVRDAQQIEHGQQKTV